MHRALTEDDQGRAITLAGMTREREILTSAEVVSALRTVAARLGATDFTPVEYEETREQINLELGRRHLHGQAVRPLPSLHTIRFKMSFPECMSVAGLSSRVVSYIRGMPRADAIALFFEHCGFFPRQADTAWFARVNGIQLLDITTDRHAPAARIARERFAEQGRWCPPANQAPRPEGWQEAAQADTPALQAARAAFPRSKREGYTLEELRAAIDRALDLLPPGQKLTEITYRALHRQHGLISPGVINKMGKRYDTSFGRLVREVVANRVSAMRDTPSAETT